MRECHQHLWKAGESMMSCDAEPDQPGNDYMGKLWSGNGLSELSSVRLRWPALESLPQPVIKCWPPPTRTCPRAEVLSTAGRWSLSSWGTSPSLEGASAGSSECPPWTVCKLIRLDQLAETAMQLRSMMTGLPGTVRDQGIRRMQQNSLGDIAGEARRKKDDQDSGSQSPASMLPLSQPLQLLGTIRSSQHYESDDVYAPTFEAQRLKVPIQVTQLVVVGALITRTFAGFRVHPDCLTTWTPNNCSNILSIRWKRKKTANCPWIWQCALISRQFCWNCGSESLKVVNSNTVWQLVPW